MLTNYFGDMSYILAEKNEDKVFVNRQDESLTDLQILFTYHAVDLLHLFSWWRTFVHFLLC